MPSKNENKKRTDRQKGKRYPYERNRQTILYRENVCAICGQPVDKTLPPGLPMSPEVDHIIPVSRGGDPTSLDNLQLVHKACNLHKGSKIPQQEPVKPEKPVNNRDLPWSINWLEYDGGKGYPPEDDTE